MAAKMITLKSSDGETFEIEDAVAKESKTLSNMIEDDCADATIPLPNIKSNIVAKVIEYCKRHLNAEKEKEKATTEDKKSVVDDELKKFDEDFMTVERDTLFEIILAANFLNIKSLLDISCQAVADSIKKLSVEDVRDVFSIENDHDPEEEAALRKEYAWAFEED